MGNGQQPDIRPIEPARHLVGGHADLLHQPHLVSIHRGQAVEQVDLFPVGGRIPEHTQRVQRGDSVLGLLRAVHALGLVNDNDRVRVLNVTNRRLAVEPVLLLVDDVLRLAESVNIDYHDLNIAAGGEGTHIGQLCGVVDKIAAGRVVVEGGKMLLGDLQGLIHALPYSDGRDYDDKLGKAVLFMQFKNRLGVNVGLARPRLHLNGKLISRQIVRLGQVIPLLNRPHIGPQRLFADTKSVSNTVFRLQDSLISTLLHAKGSGGSPLSLKEGADGINGSGLEVLLLEFEFHLVESPLMCLLIRLRISFMSSSVNAAHCRPELKTFSVSARPVVIF